ncbi:MAG: (2Fe-2S)-binding protein [Fidelibacterota bacterium]
MEPVTLIVNGVSRTLLVEPQESLLETLRERLGLTGAKLGCDQGSCGACTVLVAGKPVLSCLTPTLRCEGQEITTIEGIAINGNLHPVQEQLVKKGGIQCGYCTPGMVLTAVAFLKDHPEPRRDEIQEALSGNLCRCTGYKKIIEAVQAAAKTGKN